MSKELTQMGAAKVFLTEYSGVQCIEKRHASIIEINFYQNVAPLLKDFGVRTPQLIGVRDNDLMIEYIPNPVTLTELNSNPDTFAQLSSLHRALPSISECLKHHEWSLQQTENALQLLKLPQTIVEALINIQNQSDVLFKTEVVISGDTNEGNWGRRSNGELVLFDWERFGKGSPAIDLAPLVKRMGSLADFEAIIDNYLKHNSDISGCELLRHLIIAKCWIVVEVVNLLQARQKEQLQMYLKWYREVLPNWLGTVEKAL
ncbi:choline kinase [Photobacterium sp. OFAV2-7]|uniref:choline kinase n=1 Tax=Photobacterium sp. OFAV2-7 TaxID=2917748 RepID=UPI001EF66E42|nr:choline kinase [Photobacterium sp. OFAV2-7]MCG7584862.1 choline kinase [Photobacterium sp. OFAV2-7]